MISRKDLEKMMPIVERSREDRQRDKMRGQKEGSKDDRAADMAQARRMLLVRGSKNQTAPKGWKG